MAGRGDDRGFNDMSPWAAWCVLLASETGMRVFVLCCDDWLFDRGGHLRT